MITPPSFVYYKLFVTSWKRNTILTRDEAYLHNLYSK